MADEDRFRDGPTDLDELREDWMAVFGEGMPWGFEVGEQQIPLLRQCVEERSREQLNDYIRSLPANRLY